MGDEDLFKQIVYDAVTTAFKTFLKLLCGMAVVLFGFVGMYLENMRTDIKEVAQEQIIIRTKQSKMEANYISFDGRLDDFDARVIRLEDKY